MDARGLAERAAHRLTHWIGRRWGDSLPFYYVSEFPKSGGTWVARMVADYLQIPFPQYGLLPYGFSCVVQNHWSHDPALRRVLYVFRDGRDVMTSLYFHRARIARHSERPGRRATAGAFERLFGPDWDPRDVVEHLPRFIEHELSRPRRGAALAWPEHVEGWLSHVGEGRVTPLRYEDLRRDCVGALGGALAAVTGEAIDPWRLEVTVEKMSMRRQTGRVPGEADPRHSIRKGIVGDWRNTFSRQAALVFDELAGETLVRLGYEPDRAWARDWAGPTVS